MKRIILMASAILTLAAAPTSSPKGVKAVAAALTTPRYCITIEARGKTASVVALDGTRTPESLTANLRNAILATGMPNYPLAVDYSRNADGSIAPSQVGVPIQPPPCPPPESCGGPCYYYTECGLFTWITGGSGTTWRCKSGDGCSCVKIHLVCGM